MTRRARTGFATVEFALMLPLILLLFAGVLDYTMLMRTAIAVADAARAGAQYGSASNSNAADSTGMQTAAKNAAPDITGLTATATRFCKCSDGASVDCTKFCVTGAVQVYVQVTAKTTVSPIFSYSQLPFTGAVSTTATMRAR